MICLCELSEPGPPSNLKVRANSPSQLAVSWGIPEKPNSNITEYWVRWQKQELAVNQFSTRDFCRESKNLDLSRKAFCVVGVNFVLEITMIKHYIQSFGQSNSVYLLFENCFIKFDYVPISEQLQIYELSRY